MTLDQVRQHALALDAVTEAPHHTYGSLRVRGKIFVTWPPAGDAIHVFVGEEDRARALVLHPGFVEKLYWGRQAVGLRVTLAGAKAAAVLALVDRAYATRVAKDAGPRKPPRR